MNGGMEVEEVQPCKRSRIGNGSNSNHQQVSKIGRKNHQDADDEADGEGKGSSQFRAWHNHTSSRIFRVPRASGGKDRHSKVVTAKGLRDRRVRLSVSTAIQFYDLQDRLGFDQPSKAVEWLINAASAAIAKLPALDSPFPEPPKPNAGEERRMEQRPEPDAEADPSCNQHLSLTKSGCSSTSDTSKGSVLSLSRSEIRDKARERARERAAKDRDKDGDEVHVAAHHHAVSSSLNSPGSFTELLTGGSSNRAAVTAAQPSSSANCIPRQARHMPPATATADYFSQVSLFGQAQKPHHQPQSFPNQTHFGNGSPMAMVPFHVAAAAAADHPEMQQVSFMQDHMIPFAAVPAGDYNINFSISSGLSGFNRGTLQSNSTSQLPHHHLQRLSSPVDGSNLPFFFGHAAPVAAATSADNQFPPGFEGRLQFCYGDFKEKERAEITRKLQTSLDLSPCRNQRL